MLRVIMQKMLGNSRLAVVGLADNQHATGPYAAGFALQHDFQPSKCLPRAGIADPSIGGHTGQALGGGQLDQLAHLGAKVSQVHRLLYHCSMSSNGCGNSTEPPPGSAGAADVAGS